MAGTQELLQAILNMQGAAQESLPVIPNNGNPGGANNMPTNQQPAVMPTSHMDFSRPSPSMANIRQMLANPVRRAGQAPNAHPNFNLHSVLDMMRSRFNGAQQAPANTGVVGPQYQNPIAPRPMTPILPVERRRDVIPKVVK